MDEELSNIIELTDETGGVVKFEFIDLIEYDGGEYVILLPVEDEDSGNVVILQVIPNDDETESYVAVESEDVLVAVFDLFKEKFKNEFTFED